MPETLQEAVARVPKVWPFDRDGGVTATGQQMRGPAATGPALAKTGAGLDSYQYVGPMPTDPAERDAIMREYRALLAWVDAGPDRQPPHPGQMTMEMMT